MKIGQLLSRLRINFLFNDNKLTLLKPAQVILPASCRRKLCLWQRDRCPKLCFTQKKREQEGLLGWSINMCVYIKHSIEIEEWERYYFISIDITHGADSTQWYLVVHRGHCRTVFQTSPRLCVYSLKECCKSLLGDAYFALLSLERSCSGVIYYVSLFLLSIVLQCLMKCFQIVMYQQTCL